MFLYHHHRYISRMTSTADIDVPHRSPAASVGSDLYPAWKSYATLADLQFLLKTFPSLTSVPHCHLIKLIPLAMFLILALTHFYMSLTTIWDWLAESAAAYPVQKSVLSTSESTTAALSLLGITESLLNTQLKVDNRTLPWVSSWG